MRPLHLLIPVALALGASTLPFVAQAQIGVDVTVTEAPPELPVYDQPPLPAPGYIFMPGYWAYGYSGYYWVPGTWIEPPEPGLLWTPGYWGWNAGRYLFNAGYWGPTVGYYGGINYGFGYGGLGYEGGYWRGGSFFYNSRVNNFGGVHVSNVFERNVTRVTVNRYSFNGPNGVNRQPSPVELAAARAPHFPPTPMQAQHIQAAQQNRSLLASVNRGRPAVLATPRPAAFGEIRQPGASPHMGMQAPGPHTVPRIAPRPTADGIGGQGTRSSYAPTQAARPAPPSMMRAPLQREMPPRPPAYGAYPREPAGGGRGPGFAQAPRAMAPPQGHQAPPQTEKPRH